MYCSELETLEDFHHGFDFPTIFMQTLAFILPWMCHRLFFLSIKLDQELMKMPCIQLVVTKVCGKIFEIQILGAKPQKLRVLEKAKRFNSVRNKHEIC